MGKEISFANPVGTEIAGMPWGVKSRQPSRKHLL